MIILLILVLLLRSVVAPWYLLVSVGLGFGATLGASVLVFQVLGGRAGLVFLLPIYMYLFVVALGTDYNILMIARLREEAREGDAPGRPPPRRCGTPAPTIGAAGLILAGTFASLMLAGNTILSAAGLRGVVRDRAGRVRDGDVLLAQPHRAHRAPRLVARPRRPGPDAGGAATAGAAGGRAVNPSRPCQ